jgi:hypothetical protein
MNAKDSVACPCLSGRTYQECCAPYAESPMRSGDHSLSEAKASMRRHILEMVRVSAGMQELWFACLDNLDDPTREAIDALESQQVFLDHFLWDWFKKYSEARPIIRVARFFEPTDLRLANHLDGWSLAAWEPWIVQGFDRDRWHLMQMSSHREVEAIKAYDHHKWSIGDGIVTRILHHAGHDFTGLHTECYPGSSGIHELETRWKALATKHGIPPQSRLRPDIHNEIWLSLHEGLLAAALKTETKPVLSLSPPPTQKLEAASKPFDESILSKPLPELGGQTPVAASKNEFGRHRLRKWLDTLAGTGLDVAKLRKKLGF